MPGIKGSEQTADTITAKCPLGVKSIRALAGGAGMAEVNQRAGNCFPDIGELHELGITGV